MGSTGHHLQPKPLPRKAKLEQNQKKKSERNDNNGSLAPCHQKNKGWRRDCNKMKEEYSRRRKKESRDKQESREERERVEREQKIAGKNGAVCANAG